MPCATAGREQKPAIRKAAPTTANPCARKQQDIAEHLMTDTATKAMTVPAQSDWAHSGVCLVSTKRRRNWAAVSGAILGARAPPRWMHQRPKLEETAPHTSAHILLVAEMGGRFKPCQASSRSGRR